MEPTVAIVGRPNVGKSALFNALVGRDVSLVFDRPGTTRDRLVATARWEGRRLTLIDTGGIGVDDEAGFQDEIAHEVDLALAAATAIIFVVDAREGLMPLDQAVARHLRKSHIPVFVAANKMDSDKQEKPGRRVYALRLRRRLPPFPRPTGGGWAICAPPSRRAGLRRRRTRRPRFVRRGPRDWPSWAVRMSGNHRSSMRLWPSRARS